MKILKWTFGVILIILIGAQFVRPEKNSGTIEGEHYLATSFTVPPEVTTIMRGSCFNCHSNNTDYPWYAEVMPVGWWLNDHVTHGKSHLNFSEFTDGSLRRQYHKFEEIAEMVEKDAMPLPSYLYIHRHAKLSPEQKRTLIEWSMAMREGMRSAYPADSLERRR